NIHLAQLGDNLFSRMLLPSHDDILHMAQSHTSGRTTFQGAGHKNSAQKIGSDILSSSTTSQDNQQRPRDKKLY
ncbi:MAG: hypothetical protein WAP03_25580, partial [Methylorubrum rhodinum]|uniref:hypothetical protein n=1 Tax=Methylorubrum rhodinum TaxID=29428 RepID=UPI003BAFFE96